MRRLYSTFAGGWPGIGLILMRLAVGLALVSSAYSVQLNHSALSISFTSVLLGIAALLLILGLYTPIVGTLVALFESCRMIAIPADRLMYLLMAIIAAALAMLGPGLWSVDARLFGWKRIEPSARRK
ncbi:MAG: hypothetical protein WCA10_09175 [Terracidiphilus sp.]